jgi:YfiH family protein
MSAPADRPTKAHPTGVATIPALLAVPGLAHGFDRRGPAASPETRADTRSRLVAALAPWGRLCFLRQVHGRTVVEAAPGEECAADAHVTGEPGLLLGVETADCLPMLLVDPERRLVAAVHAGWRGTAAGVAGAAVEALRARGATPASLLAALGPAIGACCYEVGDELREAFGPAGAAFFRPGPRGRPHLDVRAANVAQLRQAGVRPERIHHEAECTYCGPDRYPSYRREGPGAGRIVSFVGFSR